MLRRGLAIFTAAIALGGTAAWAEGNLASRPERLEPLLLGGDLSFSVTEYHLETGKYYRWRIVSDGGEEFLVRAPDLMRNSWVEQVVIEGIEVAPLGSGLYGVEFDDEGTADVWFVPIRPGNFDYFVDGYEERGMRGTFVVR